jgi:EamA domain-containing membrane protein RarD
MFPPMKSDSPRDLVLLLHGGADQRQPSVAAGEKAAANAAKILLALSAVLVGGNWLLFIWAVNNHHAGSQPRLLY